MLLLSVSYTSSGQRMKYSPRLAKASTLRISSRNISACSLNDARRGHNGSHRRRILAADVKFTGEPVCLSRQCFVYKLNIMYICRKFSLWKKNQIFYAGPFTWIVSPHIWAKTYKNLREFGNLAGIPDNYEKTVVTYSESAPNTYQGIRQMSLREFLLG